MEKREILITTLVMLFLPFIAKAQAEVGRWSIRPMVGVSASYYTHGNNAGPYNSYDTKPGFDDGIYKFRPRFGADAGVEAIYQINRRWNVAGGVHYLSSGGKKNYLDNSDHNDFKFNLYREQLTFPVMANYTIVKGLSIGAGISPGFYFNCRMHNTGKMPWSYEGDEPEGFVSKFNLSVPLDITYEFSRFSLSLRAYLAATSTKMFNARAEYLAVESQSVSKLSQKSISGDDRLIEHFLVKRHNHVFSLTFGYRFQL